MASRVRVIRPEDTNMLLAGKILHSVMLRSWLLVAVFIYTGEAFSSYPQHVPVPVLISNQANCHWSLI